jgi:hypothetical protein
MTGRTRTGEPGPGILETSIVLVLAVVIAALILVAVAEPRDPPGGA